VQLGQAFVWYLRGVGDALAAGRHVAHAALGRAGRRRNAHRVALADGVARRIAQRAARVVAPFADRHTLGG